MIYKGGRTACTNFSSRYLAVTEAAHYLPVGGGRGQDVNDAYMKRDQNSFRNRMLNVYGEEQLYCTCCTTTELDSGAESRGKIPSNDNITNKSA